MARSSKNSTSQNPKRQEAEPSSDVQAETGEKNVTKQLSCGWKIEPAATRGFLVRRNSTPMRTFPTQELADKYVKRFSR